MSSSPFRPPGRAPPPPSRVLSFVGLENVVPPACTSRDTLLSRSYRRSPLPSHSDLDKPLPVPNERRTSSVYSGDSGYTKIIASYEDRDEDLPPLPPVVQPKPYRGDTISAFLNHRFTPAQSPEPVPAVPATHKASRQSRSLPSFRLRPDQSSTLSAVDSRHAPSFAEFSRNITSRRNAPVSETPRPSRDYERSSLNSADIPASLFSRKCAVTFHGQDRHSPAPLRTQVREEADPELLPAPLDVVRAGRYVEPVKLPVALIPVEEAQRRAEAARIAYLKEHPRDAEESSAPDRHLVKSSSSDNFVGHAGLRKSLKSMIKEGVRKRREERAGGKTQASRVRGLSIPETQYVGLKDIRPESGSKRKYSWASSRRSSIKDGVSSLMKALSIGSSGGDAARGRTVERGPRRRPLAVPVTSYQKYGAEVWLAKNKKKRTKTKRNANGVQRAPTKKAGTRSEQRQTAPNISRRSWSPEVKATKPHQRS